MSRRTQSPRKLPPPRRATVNEVVFGAIELPMVVEDAGTPHRPTALVFLDTASRYAFSPHLVRDVTAEAVNEAWRGLLAELARLGVTVPRRIRTTDPALASALRAAAGDAVTVAVAPTPELADLRAAMLDYTAGGVPISYFHGQPFASEMIREFFAAAAAFRKEEPWRVLSAEEGIALDIPELGLEDAAVSVITDEGHGGLQIFPSDEVYSLPVLADQEAQARAVSRGSRAVMFYSRRQLPDSLRDESKRLPFTPLTGPIPAILAFDDRGLRRPVTREDYAIVIATLRAVTSFAAEHRAQLAAGDDAAGVYTVECGDGELEVALQLGSGSSIDSARPGVSGEGPRPSADSVHRLKLTLAGARPPIWRQLEVPSTLTLADLHRVLQIVMDWDDEHLHVFRHEGREIGPPDARAEFDEQRTELWAVARPGKLLRYNYDFGDDWVVDIEVVDVYEAEAPLVPRCLDGRRAGPPEDCGGLPGLHALVRRGATPDHDPAKFSLDAVNLRLRRALATLR